VLSLFSSFSPSSSSSHQYLTKSPSQTVESYVSLPSIPTEKGILILPDVLGHTSINVQLIADAFTAAHHYAVYVPDIFHGDPIPPNRPSTFDMQGWRSKHTPERIEPVIQEVLAYMRDPAKGGLDRIAGIGYCFGAKCVIRFLKGGKAGLDVGYVAHPSSVSIEEVEDIKSPFSIAAAETDRVFPLEMRAQTETVLKGLDTAYQGEKLPWEIHVFSGVSHGFAVRGDKENETQKWAIEQAFSMAGRWFERFL
jgi:dienelactone hydrolase